VPLQVVSFPREQLGVSSGSEWRSLGEITDRVLGHAASQCAVVSRACTIQRFENDNWSAKYPRADRKTEGEAPPPSPRNRQAL
jgi:hypothetical protein